MRIDQAMVRELPSHGNYRGDQPAVELTFARAYDVQRRNQRRQFSFVEQKRRIRRMAPQRLAAREGLVDQHASCGDCVHDRWHQRAMQIVEHNHRRIAAMTEQGCSAFEIQELGRNALDVPQRAEPRRIAIDRMHAPPAGRQESSVAPAAGRHVED